MAIYFSSLVYQMLNTWFFLICFYRLLSRMDLLSYIDWHIIHYLKEVIRFFGGGGMDTMKIYFFEFAFKQKCLLIIKISVSIHSLFGCVIPACLNKSGILSLYLAFTSENSTSKWSGYHFPFAFLIYIYFSFSVKRNFYFY